MLSYIKSLWKNGGFDRFILIVTLLFLACMIPTLRGITEENDFQIFYSAAEDLRNGISMYNGPHLYGMWYYYSPLFAAVLVPFTYLPLFVLKLVWLFFSLFMLFRIFKLIFQFLEIPENHTGKWLLGLIVLTSVHASFLNLLHGQMTILVLWCCLEGSWLAFNGKNIKGASAFALGINIKILPVFFFYSYLLKLNFKMIMAMGVAVLALILLPYVFLPTSFHTELLQGWWDMIDPRNSEHIMTVGEGGFIDFASLVTKYFTNANVPTEAQLNIANLTQYEVFLTQSVFRLFILIATAWMFLKIHPKLKPAKFQEFANLSFILLCIPVAFPHQRDYSIFMCLPAFAMLLQLWFVHKFRPGMSLLILTILAVTATGSVFFLELFGHKMRVFIYETRLNGFGALALIPLYMMWLWKFTRPHHKISMAQHAAKVSSEH